MFVMYRDWAINPPANETMAMALPSSKSRTQHQPVNDMDAGENWDKLKGELQAFGIA